MASPDRLAATTNLEPLREDGPYILRPLLEHVPLTSDGSDSDVKINCVEFYDGNLYIGTSASEVLHFVQIPPEPNDTTGQPVYIQASRLSPVSVESPSSRTTAGQGVQEILLLPRIGKACILCNSTAAFYTLPELSPVSGISVVKNCSWIGGVDLNDAVATDGSGRASGNDATILLSLKSKIQVVRLADKVLEAPKVTFAGSVLSVRRDSIACVADSKSYALLDIYRRLTIPLMSISTLDETPVEDVGRLHPQQDGPDDPITRSGRSNLSAQGVDTPSHSRSPSQNDDPSKSQQPSPPVPSTSPEPYSDSKSSPPPTNKPLPPPPAEDASHSKAPPVRYQSPFALKPHITSPNPEEFLLVIGTKLSEPGVGMFVSLDGEPTRATLQFEKYPDQVIVDGNNFDMASSQTGFVEEEDSYVLASMSKETENGPCNGIEIQHVNAGQEANPKKYWLEAQGSSGQNSYGLRAFLGRGEIRLGEVVSKLSQKRFAPFPGPLETSTSSLKSSDSRTALSIERLSKEKELFERDDSQDDDSLPEGWESTRNAEGEDFARRLAAAETRLAVWHGNRLWWAIRNPLIIQLDTLLDAASPKGQMADIDRQAVYSVLKLIRGRDARTELEYMTLDYLRQKAGLLLLINLLSSPQKQLVSDGELNALEDILVDSKLDPRVVLSLVPGIRNDIIEGRRGIWIYTGVKTVAESYLRSVTFETPAKNALQRNEIRIMHFLRRFLSAWRKMKGFGSVPDENEVFRTVDAALLICLLELIDALLKAWPMEVLLDQSSMNLSIKEWIVSIGLSIFSNRITGSLC
ncbi:TGF beta receptor associated protein 1 [Pochonia chlamydosporia 170]|uniref:TGF beta receptor associated protein 1 n=1 Tax=Pochonia chlamydosporia 170 TaxID=1380566 RepID=A0A179FRR2_METCM|nr:TGF beta receptor associated protein 1 [Pochonia chlamydosporia 170]OAQ68315.2 TGF beta receptor associated protein 1 [Pochonia chlamydosporia 170]